MKKCAAVAFVMFYLASQSFCSQSGGTGQTYIDQWGIKRQVISRACVGGPPDYCAPTDMRIILAPAINYPQVDLFGGGPAVGVPFIEPGSGTEITRVTDYNTQVAGIHRFNFGTNSSAEQYQCTAYNSQLVADLVVDSSNHHLPWSSSDGGYVCLFLDDGGNTHAFALDAVTMQTQGISSPNYPNWIFPGLSGPSLTDPWLIWASSGISIQYYCLAGSPVTDPICGGKGDTTTTLFTPTSGACPNIPSGLLSGTTLGDLQADVTDTIIGAMVDIEPTADAGVYQYYFVYNKSSGSCIWMNAFNGTYGGTGISGVQNIGQFTDAALPMAPPTGSQSFGTTGSGSLSAGTYCVQSTYESSNLISYSETLPNTINCIAVGASSSITVNRPTVPTDAATNAIMNAGTKIPPNWNVYACQESSPPTQCTVLYRQNSSEYAWSNTTFSISSLVTTGTQVPTSPASGFDIHQARLTRNGLYVGMTATAGGTDPYSYGSGVWVVPQSPSYQAPFYFLNQGGHWATGTNTVAVGLNNHGMTQFGTFNYPNILVNTYTQQTGIPTMWPYIGNDIHPVWADNAFDTYPAAGTYTPTGYKNIGWTSGMTGGIADGTWMRYGQPGWTNPVFNRSVPYENEGIAWENHGTGRIWRFFDTRDGGAQVVNSGDTWQADASISTGTIILDAYGNFETATTGGTTGSVEPSWPNPGGNTNDGTVVWNCTSGYGTFQGQNILGTTTPDGKFMVFTSLWDWTGCVEPGWKPNVVETVGNQVCDSAGMIQKVSSVTGNAETGTAYPPFNENSGQHTPDGNVTWTAQYQCWTVTEGGCYTNVFVARLK